MENAKNMPALKSPWVIGMLCLIAVVLTANITMIVIAQKTSPGLVVEDYYEKGKNYHRSLEKIAAEKSLGWKADLLSPEKTLINEPSLLRVSVSDGEGRPVIADMVRFHAFRPSDAARDFFMEMKAESAGIYAGSATFPLPGHWDVVVTVRRDGDEFDFSERMFIQKVSI